MGHDRNYDNSHTAYCPEYTLSQAFWWIAIPTAALSLKRAAIALWPWCTCKLSPGEDHAIIRVRKLSQPGSDQTRKKPSPILLFTASRLRCQPGNQKQSR